MWPALNYLSLSLAIRTRPENGQVLVEYAFVLALISIVAIALLIAIGQDLATPLQPVVGAFDKA